MKKYIELFNGTNKFQMLFVFCPPGKYWVSNIPRLSKKNAIVEFSKAFWLKEMTVSLGLYKFIFGKSYVEQELYYGIDLTGIDKNLFPWFGIDFGEIEEFIERLNKIAILNNVPFVFDVPSIAEWEHALLCGKDKTWSWGHIDSELGEYGWYKDNSEDKVHAWKQKKCND